MSIATNNVPHGPTSNAKHASIASQTFNAGMPPLENSGPALSSFEFWPTRLFYIPVALHIAYLGLRYGGLTLPTVANPNFPLGGLVGESKSEILGAAEGQAKERIANFTTIVKSTNAKNLQRDASIALAKMENESLTFPVVAKPDMGCRGAGVKIIRGEDDLITYLKGFPPGESIILQTLVPFEPEAGVFYIRRPGEKKGRVFSLTLKYFPYVVGDGKSTIKELVMDDPRASQVSHLYLPRHKRHLGRVLPKGAPYRLAFAGSHCRGAIFRNGNKYITEEMRETFDRVADGLPGFCFGRFDVRFPNLKELQRGGEFQIVEVNGAGGEATHIWDSRTSLSEAYRSLREQFRLAFEIGAENKKRGYRPASVLEVFRAYRREGALTVDYPLTD